MSDEAFKGGLDARTLSLIRRVIAKEPRVREMVLFGSRAKGTQRPESDVDLALKGDVDADLVARVAFELAELPLPYEFDVVDYHALRHAPLREHIDRVGKVLYVREPPVVCQ